MESGGDLRRVQHQTLPPRKRAGWTGGSSREPRRTVTEDQVTFGATAGEPRAKEAGLEGGAPEIRAPALNYDSSEGRVDTRVEQG